MKPFFYIIPILFIFCGCSFDYEEGKIAEDLSDTVPETVLLDFVQVRTLEGKLDHRVYGSKAEIYGKKKETLISDVVFQDFNSEGEIETEGTAELITYFSETDNAEMSGNLHFYNTEEEVEVQAEYLYWDDAAELLTAKETEPVTLVKRNGTELTGTGFSAQGDSKTVVFTGRVEGTWVEDEKEEETKDQQ